MSPGGVRRPFLHRDHVLSLFQGDIVDGPADIVPAPIRELADLFQMAELAVGSR